jgi:predicted amino acid-binding ACT domain protein
VYTYKYVYAYKYTSIYIGTKSIITGAVFGSVPHIVQIDDYMDTLAFKPESNYVLTFRNEDRPGVISEVLTVLNNANVNVASLNVTRGPVGATQSMMSFLALDDDIPMNAITALRSNPNLSNVAKIQLR